LGGYGLVPKYPFFSPVPDSEVGFPYLLFPLSELYLEKLLFPFSEKGFPNLLFDFSEKGFPYPFDEDDLLLKGLEGDLLLENLLPSVLLDPLLPLLLELLRGVGLFVFIKNFPAVY
jgi:hypothetical protein